MQYFSLIFQLILIFLKQFRYLIIIEINGLQDIGKKGGIKVIPTIEWGTKDSYSWCFDGVPEDSIVAVSNVGCMNNKEHRRLFMDGWNEMLVRLQPRKILLFAQKLDDYKGNWEHIPYDFSIKEEVKPNNLSMPLFDELPIF